MTNPNLLVKRLTNDAQLPTRGTPLSAGWDIYCTESVDIPPGRRAVLPTGLAMAVEPGWYLRIAPRSGLAAKQGYNVHAGVIDADYRGEVKVALINHGDETLEFRRGDRIAQAIMERCSTGALIEVTDLPETSRGTHGLGSTGR
ncbi:dUTP diphosphatase [Vreelandella massiliensis]|uniref:dUTP diphosphatase n=1 Tax=Vreelandella massiliensis TaxID=1816686 RepID=UPI00096A70FC|nr:dUTP diphosphatase [Halomonas massiliensis]